MRERAARGRIEWMRAVLPAWFIAMTFTGAALMARHTLALPAPTKGREAFELLRTAGIAPGSWTAVHVLASGCRCSRRVAEHLSRGPRPVGWTEVVAWSGDEPAPSELGTHMTLRRIDAATLARFGIEAAPLLVVVSPSSEIVYAGGYTERKQAAVFHDVDILQRARAGSAPAPLPLYGCATSARVRDALDRLPIPGGPP